MTNPTERPEERDSLAKIEERLEAQYGLNGPDARTLINDVKERDEKLHALASLIADMDRRMPEQATEDEDGFINSYRIPVGPWHRILGAVVGERLTCAAGDEARELREKLEDEYRAHREGCVPNERRLEAEVKELREENARLSKPERGGGFKPSRRTLLRQIETLTRQRDEARDTVYERQSRITQMEEALRERCYGDTPACYTEASGYHGCVCWTGPRAALSPSDTEERE